MAAQIYSPKYGLPINYQDKQDSLDTPLLAVDLNRPAKIAEAQWPVPLLVLGYGVDPDIGGGMLVTAGTGLNVSVASGLAIVGADGFAQGVQINSAQTIGPLPANRGNGNPLYLFVLASDGTQGAPPSTETRQAIFRYDDYNTLPGAVLLAKVTTGASAIASVTDQRALIGQTSVPLASDVTNGLVNTDVAPASSSNPEVIGVNSPAVNIQLRDTGALDTAYLFGFTKVEMLAGGLLQYTRQKATLADLGALIGTTAATGQNQVQVIVWSGPSVTLEGRSTNNTAGANTTLQAVGSATDTRNGIAASYGISDTSSFGVTAYPGKYTVAGVTGASGDYIVNRTANGYPAWFLSGSNYIYRPSTGGGWAIGNYATGGTLATNGGNSDITQGWPSGVTVTVGTLAPNTATAYRVETQGNFAGMQLPYLNAVEGTTGFYSAQQQPGQVAGQAASRASLFFLNNREDALELRLQRYINSGGGADGSGTVQVDATAGGTFAATSLQERCGNIEFIGTPSAAFIWTVSLTPRAWFFKNSTGQSVTVKTVSGTGIVIAAGATARLHGDGTNVVASSTTTTLNNVPAPTGDVSLAGYKLTNLAAPTADTDAVTKVYADALANGLTVKTPVRAATTANVTLSGLQTIDGIALAAGDRVLVKNQTSGANNGIYVAAAGAWARSTDADQSGEVKGGLFVWVNQGTAQGDTQWTLTTDDPITLGTTALTFTQFSAVSSGVTSVTGTAPIASSGGTTPAISISAATQSAAGSMSAADKTKLDGVATGATANTGTVTSVTGTAPIASSGGAAPAISITAATQSAAGSMSAADKTKLDGVATGATANTGTVTSVTGTAPIVSSGGTAPALSITAASGMAPGSMSTSDFSKLAALRPTPVLTQNAHGFAVGNWLAFNGTAWVLGKADSDTNANVMGMVTATTTNTFTLATPGQYVTGLAGLSVGVNFLSPTTAGAMTLSAPTTIGQVRKVVFFADSATSGFVWPDIGVVVTPYQFFPNLPSTPAAPSGGVLLFAQGGTAKIIVPSGAVTTIAS